MSLSNKVVSILKRHGEGITSYAEFTGRSQSNLSNKARRGTWNVKDFIEIGEMTNTRLAFIDEKGEIIMIFDKDDLEDGIKK